VKSVKKKRNKKETRKCINPNCNNVFIARTHRTTLAYCQECKEKRDDIKRKNVEAYLNRETTRVCCNCGEIVQVSDIHAPTTFKCALCIADPTRKSNETFKRKCKHCGEPVSTDKKLATLLKCEKCKNLKFETICRDGKLYRICRDCKHEFEIFSKKSQLAVCADCRNKNIQESFPKNENVKKTHFGDHGIASDGHKFASCHEQDIDEYLIARNVKHIPHPRIGESYKHADQFLPDYNIYLEVDGMDRTTDNDWYGKLSLYASLSLQYKIIKPVKTHFRDNKEECFRLLDEQLSFLKDL